MAKLYAIFPAASPRRTIGIHYPIPKFVSLAVIMAHAASPSSCWMKSIAVAGAK
jgi:hypothetical protein